MPDPLHAALTSIAENYAKGTPNGIRMDADSALIWSPSHFTWMDTNHPAGTPREGYPVEIQVLWIRLLRLLEKISAPLGAGVPPASCSICKRRGETPALPGNGAISPTARPIRSTNCSGLKTKAGLQIC